MISFPFEDVRHPILSSSSRCPAPPLSALCHAITNRCGEIFFSQTGSKTSIVTWLFVDPLPVYFSSHCCTTWKHYCICELKVGYQFRTNVYVMVSYKWALHFMSAFVKIGKKNCGSCTFHSIAWEPHTVIVLCSKT